MAAAGLKSSDGPCTLAGPMKKATAVKNYYVLPCLLLLLNLVNNVVSYKAEVVDDPFLRTSTVILLVLNAFILFLGCFIDAVSIIVLITPVALPVIHQLGIDPVLFGLLLVCNVCIGALTPPVGTCLFVASSVGRVDLSKTAVAILPIVCIAVAALVLGILFPQALLWLPDMIG